MSSRQPPSLAVWLLCRLGVAARNEPLAGDLLEEFRAGRTTAWYWRQTFMAIAAEFGQRLQFHRLDLLSLFLGWGAETCVLLAWWILHAPLGLYGFVLTVSILAAGWLVMYIEYRVRLHAWMNDGSSDEESHDIWQREISPRSESLLFFGIAVLLDGIGILVARLPWLGPADLSTLSFLLILNIVTFFFLAIAAAGVLRPRPGSSRGDAGDEKSHNLWHRALSGLGRWVFPFAIAVWCHNDKALAAQLPWLAPAYVSILTLNVFTSVSFAVVRMLRTRLNSLLEAGHPGGDK